ncbi:hypothetical protein B5S33_g4951 [[Candida] boidinii]|nr:hypothetical protein B5S30_g3191 [[Candida] boidinii]OWB86265.1 hypothetical protein B5S33_g4951 [[Candida] boidinii]
MSTSIKDEDGNFTFPEKIKVKRKRSAKVCFICRQRKVRCDVIKRHPCTNCESFGFDCVIAERKERKKLENDTASSSPNDGLKNDSDDINDNNSNDNNDNNDNDDNNDNSRKIKKNKSNKNNKNNNKNFNDLKLDTSDESNKKRKTDENNFKPTKDFAKKYPELMSIKLNPEKVVQINYRDAANKEFIGVAANQTTSTLLTGYIDHILKDSSLISYFGLSDLDLKALSILGCFTLPEASLCWKYINNYFETIHKFIPILNKNSFMKNYQDLTNPPSLFLLQAVIAAGSWSIGRDSAKEAIKSMEISKILNRKWEALYMAGIESNPIPLCQSLLIFSFVAGGPTLNKKNVYYWVRTAVITAQSFGMHKDVTSVPTLSDQEKRLYRRIWWYCIIRDKNCSIGYGRPPCIRPDDTNIPMLSSDDFIEEDEVLKLPLKYPMDEQIIEFAIQDAKLTKIIDILFYYYAQIDKVIKNGGNPKAIIEYCDIIMSKWLSKLPKRLQFSYNDKSTHSLFSLRLASVYNLLLLLLHKSNIVRKTPNSKTDMYIPSWSITFRAAHALSLIAKILLDSGLALKTSPLKIFSFYSAAMTMIYHTANSDSKIAKIAHDDIEIIRKTLDKLRLRWSYGNLALFVIDEVLKDKSKYLTVIKSMVRATNSQTKDNKNKKDYGENSNDTINCQSDSPGQSGKASNATGKGSDKHKETIELIPSYYEAENDVANDNTSSDNGSDGTNIANLINKNKNHENLKDLNMPMGRDEISERTEETPITANSTPSSVQTLSNNNSSVTSTSDSAFSAPSMAGGGGGGPNHIAFPAMSSSGARFGDAYNFADIINPMASFYQGLNGDVRGRGDRMIPSDSQREGAYAAFKPEQLFTNLFRGIHDYKQTTKPQSSSKESTERGGDSTSTSTSSTPIMHSARIPIPLTSTSFPGYGSGSSPSVQSLLNPPNPPNDVLMASPSPQSIAPVQGQTGDYRNQSSEQRQNQQTPQQTGLQEQPAQEKTQFMNQLEYQQRAVRESVSKDAPISSDAALSVIMTEIDSNWVPTFEVEEFPLTHQMVQRSETTPDQIPSAFDMLPSINMINNLNNDPFTSEAGYLSFLNS